MSSILKKVISNAESKDQKIYESALVDLRLIIERYTQNRYGDDGKEKYLLLFHDRTLIDYKLNRVQINQVKYFLIYLLFNFPDRAVLTAKCIKALFDDTIREAICAAIKIYMKTNDHATCELIFSITDVGDENNYLLNKRIVDLFIEVSEWGGEISKEVVNNELEYHKKISGKD